MGTGWEQGRYPWVRAASEVELREVLIGLMESAHLDETMGDAKERSDTALWLATRGANGRDWGGGAVDAMKTATWKALLPLGAESVPESGQAAVALAQLLTAPINDATAEMVRPSDSFRSVTIQMLWPRTKAEVPFVVTVTRAGGLRFWRGAMSFVEMQTASQPAVLARAIERTLARSLTDPPDKELLGE